MGSFSCARRSGQYEGRYSIGLLASRLLSQIVPSLVFRAQPPALARWFVKQDEGPGKENSDGGEGDEKGRVEPGSEDHGDVGGKAKG